MLATPKLLKAARNLLGLTLDEVGEAAGLSGKTVARVEAGGKRTTIEAAEAIQGVFERRGFQFLQETEEYGQGLRLPKKLIPKKLK
jgi:transcriptional regulator with XRE-family HTH domain